MFVFPKCSCQNQCNDSLFEPALHYCSLKSHDFHSRAELLKKRYDTDSHSRYLDSLFGLLDVGIKSGGDTFCQALVFSFHVLGS